MIWLADLNQFFADYEKVACAFFSTFGFLWVLVRLCVTAYNAIANKARLGQRQEWQGEYSNVWEERYNNLHADYKELNSSYHKVTIRIIKLEAKLDKRVYDNKK